MDTQPRRLIVLIGLPHSGKSAAAAALAAQGWAVIDQEPQGDCQQCQAACAASFSLGREVVVDRCNNDMSQRSVWLSLARQLHAQAIALHLEVGAAVCVQRAKDQIGHLSLVGELAEQVVAEMAANFERPTVEEGFDEVHVASSQQELDGFLRHVGNSHPRSNASVPLSEPQRRVPPHARARAAAAAASVPSSLQAASSSRNNFVQTDAVWRYVATADTFQPSRLSSSQPLQSDVARPIRAPWATPAAGTASTTAAWRSRHRVQSEAAAEADLAASHSLAGPPGSPCPSSILPAGLLHPESLQLPLEMPLPPPPPLPPSWQEEGGNGRRPHMYNPRAHRLASYKPPSIEDAPDEDNDEDADYERADWRKGGGKFALRSAARAGGTADRLYTREPTRMEPPRMKPLRMQPPMKSWVGQVQPPEVPLDLQPPVDPRPILLFDLNGTLTEHRAQKGGAGVNRMRPGISELRRLSDTFRLGIYSSATDFTVSKVVPLLEAAAGNGPALFADERLILHRGHTQEASAEHKAGGGEEWDTVKPLGRYFAQLHRLLLVDDDAYKACPGELSNMVVVPCWEKSQQDSCLRNLVSVLLQILDGMDQATDLRLYSEAISTSVAAMSEVDNSDPPADPNQLQLDEVLEASVQPAASSPSMAASSRRQVGPTADPNELHLAEGPELLKESYGDPAADQAERPWMSREPEAGRRNSYSKRDPRKDRSGEGSVVQYGVQKAGIHA